MQLEKFLRYLVCLATARALVEGRGLKDVPPAQPHPLSYLRHGGLVLRQVGPGQDRVQVGALATTLVIPPSWGGLPMVSQSARVSRDQAMSLCL